MKKNCPVIRLDSPVGDLSGIGPRKAEALKNAGINKVIDLLRISPARYQDRTRIVPFSATNPNGSPPKGVFRAKLEKIKAFHARRGLAIIDAEFSDPSGKMPARWFNKTYLTRQLIVGNEYWLFGPAIIKDGKTILSNPEIEPCNSGSDNVELSLTPVYPARSSLSAAKISPLMLRKLIAKALANIDWESSFPAMDPDSPFPAIADALKNVHRPNSENQAKKAEFTLAFFDQVLFQMGVLKRREAVTGYLTLPDQKTFTEFEPDYPLPFSLTTAQKRVLGEIVSDMTPEKGNPPMNRLLQGDVGSGKTLVAFLAMLELSEKIAPDSQCAFMAPTEVLARQHLKSFVKIFPQFADRAAILTGSQKRGERRDIESAISSGCVHFVFGTHALFQERIEFRNLQLCIIDEQQRFGVNHRRLLFRKGENPHQLLLSATPIPRTLSLTIFGDMDTSIIDELPPGRSPVKTSVTLSLAQAASSIKRAIAQGEKIYVVCPLIEESEKADWLSVEEAYEKLSSMIPEASCACLTGQQSWEEKEAIMNEFNNGDINLLIATTVIEVGVDNPDATLMVIVNADRFGLSQLHQLRGRVGRSNKTSSCILVSQHAETSDRLNILCSTNDGFEISLEDLKIRGPGDLVGTRQSGLSHPCFSHRIPQKMIENARKRGFEILTTEKPAVKDWFVKQMIASFGDSYQTFMEGG
ncbi:MAG: ATP-dependent DNA helicase RecG [Candidatus Rifleibacteriota bacterium]